MYQLTTIAAVLNTLNDYIGLGSRQMIVAVYFLLIFLTTMDVTMFEREPDNMKLGNQFLLNI